MKNIAATFHKNSENRNSLMLSKMSLFICSLVMFLSILQNPLSSSAQTCSFSLNAKNNIESVNTEGRVYFMELRNNSNEDININLSASNIKSDKNPDMTATRNNVNLNAEFQTQDGQEMTSSVTLPSNGLLNFLVKVTVPNATPIEHWNNLLVNAISNQCNNYSSSLTLFTFIPNPDEN